MVVDLGEKMKRIIKKVSQSYIIAENAKMRNVRTLRRKENDKN